MNSTAHRSRHHLATLLSTTIALSLLALASTASATHWRYGQITWTSDPGDPTKRTIRFTVQNAWRRDAYSTGNSRCIDPTQNPPAAVACTGPGGFAGVGDVIHERQSSGGTLLDPGDGSGLIGSPVTIGGSNSLLYLVTSIDAANNWLFGVALDPGTFPAPAGCGQGNAASTCDTIIEHTYAATGTYEAEIEDCCRISPCAGGNAHINNPDNGFRTVSRVDVGGGESSPVSSLPPIILCPEDALCTFDVPVSDDEVDPMSFRLATDTEAGFDDPGSAGGPGLGQPGMTAGCTDPTDGDASIGSGTGVYRWNTTGCFVAADPAACNDGSLNTLYSSQVMIEESGAINRVPLDFLIQLVPCPPNNSQPAFDSPPTPACGSTVSGSPNSPVTFTVQASDADGSDTVTINAAGLPTGAMMTPSLPTDGNPAASQFSWTPTEVQKGQHVITFSAADACSTTLCSITVDVSEEICDDGADNDGDQLSDCADPDCHDVSCDDGNACTQADFCDSGTGTCVGTDPVVCSEPDQCHTSECNPGTGQCEEGNAPNGTSCDDGDSCTAGEVCEDGVCTGDAAPNGTPCDDGDLCTTGDECTGGTCGGAPVVCPSNGDCNVGSCNPQDGQCQIDTLPDGTSCDEDNDQCTVDQCSAGACVKVNDLPGDQCQEGVVILGCEGIPEIRIRPNFAKPLHLKKNLKVELPGFNTWISKGEIIIPDATFDPDTQEVVLTLNQDVVNYQATLAPGVFTQSGSAKRPRWRFKLGRKDPDYPTAIGWRKGLFKGLPVGLSPGALNRVKYSHKGELSSIVIDPSFLQNSLGQTRLRETIRVGDVCYTSVLTCLPTEFAMRCFSQQASDVPP